MLEAFVCNALFGFKAFGADWDLCNAETIAEQLEKFIDEGVMGKVSENTIFGMLWPNKESL